MIRPQHGVSKYTKRNLHLVQMLAGKRCPQYYVGCADCTAWLMYDETKLVPECKDVVARGYDELKNARDDVWDF